MLEFTLRAARMRDAVMISIAAVAALAASGAAGQIARDILGPAGVVSLAEQQPSARIIVDPPPWR
jgi:hypothetical protein